MAKVDNETLNLLADHVFKTAVTRDDEQSRNNAKFLITTFSYIKDITSIKTMNSVISSNPETGTEMYLDSLFEVNGDTLVNIEVQRKKEDYDPDRLINYLVGMNFTYIQRNQSHLYGKCIMIFIVLYRFTEEDDGERIGRMRYPSGTVISDKMTIIVVQLTDLKYLFEKDVNDMTLEERVMLYLKYSHKKKYKVLMEELRKKEEGLMAMHNYVMNEQEATRMYFEFRKRVDRESNLIKLNEVQKKFRMEEKKRLEEQKKREKSDYIISLIKQGYSVDDAEQKANREFVDVLVY